MTSHEANDPIFSRLKAAWMAYESIQIKSQAGRVPYAKAVADETDLIRQAAAQELADARSAWLDARN